MFAVAEYCKKVPSTWDKLLQGYCTFKNRELEKCSSDADPTNDTFSVRLIMLVLQFILMTYEDSNYTDETVQQTNIDSAHPNEIYFNHRSTPKILLDCPYLQSVANWKICLPLQTHLINNILSNHICTSFYKAVQLSQLISTTRCGSQHSLHANEL